MRRNLKAFAAYDGSGRLIPGSLKYSKTKPKTGDWVEISNNLCCGTTTSTTTLELT